MTSPQSQVLEPNTLDLMGFKSLKVTGTEPRPFVTIYLPACHSGAADLPRAARMKMIPLEAHQELKRRRYQGQPSQLLKPLEELVAQLGSAGGAVRWSS